MLKAWVTPDVLGRRLPREHEFLHVIIDSRSDPKHWFAHFAALNTNMVDLNMGETPDQLISAMNR